jgi:hypothetical protein
MGRKSLAVIRICERCGAEFAVPPSRRKARFCSFACTKNRVERICDHCGRSFEIPASRLKFGPALYCSNECRYEAVKVDPIASVLSRVDRSGGPDACWPYMGTRLPSGYGTHSSGGEHRYAHRVAYEAEHGPIPDGMFICHHCDNPPCCNPAHLFAGSPTENVQDMIAKQRAGFQRLAS